MSVNKGTATVYINGKNYGSHEVTISAEIGDDMPGRMNVTSGVNQRTGTIQWTFPAPVSTRQLHPWRIKDTTTGFQLPQKGDRVQIDMTLNNKVERVFTGKVDTTKGTFTSMPVTEIIDDIDRLNRVVRLPAMRHHMPPDKDTGNQYKHVALSPNATVGWLAAMCGYHLTPPDNGGRVILSVPLQGTVMTRDDTVGRVKTAWRGSGEKYDLPTFKETENGLALTEGWVSYAPYRLDMPEDTVVLSYMVKNNHAGEFIFHVTVGGVELRTVLGADRVLRVGQAAVELGTVIVEEDTLVQVAFQKNGKVTVKIPTGETSFQGSSWSGSFSDRIAFRAHANSSIAGLQVIATNGGAFPRQSFTPNLRVRMGYPYTLWYQRSIRDEKAINVLEEIASNLLSSVWIDGQGVLNVLYARVGYRDGQVHNLGTDWDIKEINWEDSTLYQANDIYVKFKTTEVDWTYRDGGSYVTLWEADDQQFNAGEESIWWIGPDENSDWVEVDTTVKHPLWSDDSMTEFLKKNGTFFGFAVPVDNDPSGSGQERWGSGTFRIETVTPWVFKVRARAQETSSSHIPKVAGIHPSMWGKAIPVVRGGALITCVNADPVKVSGGFSSAADLEHDAGKWCTDTRAQDLADHIRATSNKAQAVLTDLECFYNPQIKLSDKVTLRLGEASGGVTLTGYVLGIRHNLVSDTTNLTVRIIRQQNPWTWGQVAQDFNTYTEVENTFNTLGDLENNNRAN